ncbi:protein phosphatase CheZ [Rhodoferax sp. U11-2br]|uniref:protein phosphatase CheZ n=1 Tax=Rhodoferax sp. U11-2br TaxID=2838878 RepID=UPI001BE5A087|nr:protein phosphatase CheZ [Rhodoferax sp. U11-2br]MBT3065925.1 protein phosphatase CheZ [Rhodoferax sp. U11-2br]
MPTPLSKEEAYARLGAITREMHEALTLLGSNHLHDIVEEIPHARDRLAYVGQMTEAAADKVLTLVETAKPACDDLSGRAVELSASLARFARSEELTLQKARGLLVVCSKFVDRTGGFSKGQAEVLSDIMMAQDFQDLSGQVIKKVIDIINRTEMQLVHLLVDSSPQAAAEEISHVVPATVDTHKLDGPQTAENALKQTDVDDLLASLGF